MSGIGEGEICGLYQCLPAFVMGVATLAFVETIILAYVVTRMLKKKIELEEMDNFIDSEDVTKELEGSIRFSLQGNMWVAPLKQGDHSKATMEKCKDKPPDEDGVLTGTEEEKVEISTPVLKHAKLMGQLLCLSGLDGSEDKILVKGCEVMAISGSEKASRKWARKHPIKVRNSQHQLFGGCKECLLFVETSLEKEAWCDVLRAASKSSHEAKEWYTKYKLRFEEYCSSLEASTHHVTKFHSGANDTGVYVENPKLSGTDGVIFKGFWSAIEKWKLPKGGGAGRSNQVVSNQAVSNLAVSRRGALFSNINRPTTPPPKHGKIGGGVDTGATSSQRREESNDADIDRGNVFVNMFVARLFFDWSRSTSLQAKYHEQLQQMLSKTKIPGFIEQIAVTSLNFGKFPPLLSRLWVLPADSEGTMSLGIGIEYVGGAYVTCETRVVNVRLEAHAHTHAAKSSVDPASEDVTVLATPLHNHDHEGSLLVVLKNLPGHALNRHSIGAEFEDEVRESHHRGWRHAIKAALDRLAARVSQVPLQMSVKLVSFKGTVLIKIRPPPCDHIWLCFQAMPHLEMAAEVSIGDHKINNAFLGRYIVQVIKKTLKKEWVYPNAKDVHLKWMISDPEDWLPHSCLPVAFTPSKGIKDDSDTILTSLDDDKDESEYSLGASSMEEEEDDEDDESSAIRDTSELFSI